MYDVILKFIISITAEVYGDACVDLDKLIFKALK
jgi:hypothetical protein